MQPTTGEAQRVPSGVDDARRQRTLTWARRRRQCPGILVLLLLVRPCEAVSGSKWYTEDYEKDYMNALILICFVMIAVSVERVFHAAHHYAGEAYAYGELHKTHNLFDHAYRVDGDGNQHVQLVAELINRMGGEFMSLGALTVTIFLTNQCGGFELLADEVVGNDDFHYPASDLDWLYLSEVVHMKLFLGMVLYFCIILRMVKGSEFTIRTWEFTRLRRLKTGLAPTDSVVSPSDINITEFEKLRHYTLDMIRGWQSRRPKLFNKVLAALDIDTRLEEGAQAEKLAEGLEKHFNLAAYLAKNVEEGVVDAIRVHAVTWLSIGALFFLFALLHRYAGITLRKLVVPIIILMFLLLCGMWYLSRQQMRVVHEHIERIAKDKDCSSTTDDTPHKLSIHQRWNTEKIALRVLQVFMFLIAFVCSDVVIDPDGWKKDFLVTALETLSFLLLLVFLGSFVARRVPQFLMFMACPPYVDDDNLVLLISTFKDMQLVTSATE